MNASESPFNQATHKAPDPRLSADRLLGCSNRRTHPEADEGWARWNKTLAMPNRRRRPGGSSGPGNYAVIRST